MAGLSVKDLLSADDLDDADLADVLSRAAAIADGTVPARTGAKMIGLFFEQESTRTRIGFDVAASRLGHHVVDVSASPGSRLGKPQGEDLEDHIRTISEYCDLIVARTEHVAIVEAIARLTHLPVINGGNGIGEHPTQALVDLFTIQRRLGDIRQLSVALSCDPTARHALSFMKLLKLRPPRRFTLCLPPETLLSNVVAANIDDLRQHGTIVDRVDAIEATLDHDVLSIQTQKASSIISGRIGEMDTVQHVEDEKFTLTADKILRSHSKTMILNPLPRHSETDKSCDSLPNAAYFEQVRLSIPIRMAILSRMLSGRRWAGRSRLHSQPGWPETSSPISCSLLPSVSSN
jgi:aspartate carbamoyltransferase catalytic subunit